MIPTLVCFDRDGTLTVDDNYYLGSAPNWKEQVELLDGVVEGIRMLNRIPQSSFFVLTNQSGVALRGEEFGDLTEDRMREVNEYVLSKLRDEGLRIDGYFACPFVDDAYVKKAEARGREVDPHFVMDNHPDLKPNPGMVRRALKQIGQGSLTSRVFMVGDRASDVEMGLRVGNGSTGILVAGPKTEELHDLEKIDVLRRTYGSGAEIYVAENFLDAAQHIVSHFPV